MDRQVQPLGHTSDAGAVLAKSLPSKLQGDVRFDPLWRTLYATDASIYEIVPLGVVLPQSVDDVAATVRECRAQGVSVIARGGGTGLTGGAVGPGVQVDLSRYMNRIGRLNVGRRTVEVEAGVVLDDLNIHLAPSGLRFGPDIATASRATLGGMIANNSCGANSVLYGRTVDHIAELTVVLADGTVATFVSEPSGSKEGEEPSAAVLSPGISAWASARGPVSRAAQIEDELSQIRDKYYDEIKKRFPKVMRSNGGYGLDRLGAPGTSADVIKILCGSEGTLAIVVGAKLKLVEVPKATGLLLVHFNHLLDALGVTAAILQHRPAAVELVDRMILDAGRANAALAKRCTFLQGDPNALLIVEFHDQDAVTVESRIEGLLRDASAMKSSTAHSTIIDPQRQADVWKLRSSGLGLLMSKPGDAQSYAFVEDTAVDPKRLRDYIERFSTVLAREGVEAGYYAHASVGCIHVRPVLNLKTEGDVQRMGRIADAVSDLAIEFSGAMTGEHGDGIVRSCWLDKMYGPRIMQAFKEVKHLFDSEGLLNPHKIVDPWPMTEHLRYGSSFESRAVKTHLDFSAFGGMAGLAGMCSGVGPCRQRLIGTMCPSYMATGDELHTTRARANALRVALSNRGLLDGLDDPQLAEVMDLCLSCKACKTECPTGVDMAGLKSEYLSRLNLIHGVSRRARAIADLPGRLALASRFPKLWNVLTQSRVVRAAFEWRYRLDRRVAAPRLARQTFRAWFRRYQKRGTQNSSLGSPGRQAPRGSVVYFVDTWTNYVTPQVGVAAVMLLEQAGFRVLCPPTDCCGRPAISQGLLTEARHLAEQNVRRLAPFAASGVPIVGTEPSCILTLLDEYPQLVRTPAAGSIAAATSMIETFLLRVLEEDPAALSFSHCETPLLYHGHCHQKALVGTEDAVALLRLGWGEASSEIDSGCCGMAGAFGHEVEHYDVAKAIGEHRLFPAIRNRGEALVAVSGFSCRHQIEHHTAVRPRHVVEHLAERLCAPDARRT